MRALYTTLFCLLLPLILLRLWWRGRRAPAYRRRWRERFGLFPAPAPQPAIWVHAVSVGETIAAAPLVRALQVRYPEHRLVVTTTTPTGSERVQALFGDRVFHVYGPYDTPGCVTRFLDRIRPTLTVVMETELWPNLIHGCHRRNIPVVVANARLSERSARGYARLGGLTRAMLNEVRLVLAQNAADGERFVALGLPRERLAVTGSIKFDLTLDDTLTQRAAALRTAGGERSLCWIAASTHEGEDEPALTAHRALCQRYPDALLILVPRHPERFDEVARLIDAQGFRYQRRSQAGEQIDAGTQVLLGDTMGELLLLYGCADVAFVGGSLVERGGHNTLEPAAWGIPVLTGPSDFNFSEISRLLGEAGAQVKVANADALAAELVTLTAQPELRIRRGAAAQSVMAANRGALTRHLAALAELIR
ncbi:MAG: lipid IV(A) 3-deoxy-D-manno-octulosonic acid transferase [Spongiibacteraceae bacterium]|jgi:3-deoxy-D-manno-octulosonic-acid transferase|nr:lipid IV(A) 3-deoxy-D-manno-octulosonic acid transferase [Spongiibacteraceae bacterium]